MVKLFWNTHNQIESPIGNNDYIWGNYHKKNSDKWIYEIIKKIEYKIIESEKDLENKDVLIVVDSSVEKKTKLYDRLRLICSKIYLFHLGDEKTSNNLSAIYKNCDFVWRAFCSNIYFENHLVKCIPIGYKTGVLNKELSNRKYKWSFIGTPHKSSRHDLLFQFSDIKQSFCHKTEQFNKNIISVEKMSEVLSSTIFMPCPNGFVHPETYRVYEALECGCIPIVENTYRYYDRLFPKNPFIKVEKWADAKLIVMKWTDEQIKNKQEECKSWWKKYKDNIQELIRRKIHT
tara:strand:- start:37 stop:903 length:867 start_codon:yes stop_codon:yes gene_type:complete